ncbi:MAG: RT0821/Lpp0805 family surface protein, partial [Pseudomonadota bacterium]
VDANPPPWAPAYGYRAKHKDAHKEKYKHKHKHDEDDGDEYGRAYVPPFDIGFGRCNRDLLGGLIGGAGGAAIGSTIGKGDGRTAAIIGGAIIGIIVGGSIGRSMDSVDQNCVGQALEHAPDGRTIVWQNPQNSAQYQVVPTRTVQASDGRYCREYTTTAVVAGKSQQVYGRACRQPDGSWEIQS